MLMLSPAHRRALRARAHLLKPIVWIGSQGLSEGVLHEVDQGLNSHELIKVKVAGDEWESRDELLEKICRELGAAPVQHIGKMLVLYRPQPEKTGTDTPEPGRPGKLPRARRDAVEQTGSRKKHIRRSI